MAISSSTSLALGLDPEVDLELGIISTKSDNKKADHTTPLCQKCSTEPFPGLDTGLFPPSRHEGENTHLQPAPRPSSDQTTSNGIPNPTPTPTKEDVSPPQRTAIVDTHTTSWDIDRTRLRSRSSFWWRQEYEEALKIHHKATWWQRLERKGQKVNRWLLSEYAYFLYFILLVAITVLGSLHTAEVNPGLPDGRNNGSITLDGWPLG